MHVLWLRYLTEVGENKPSVAPELLSDPEVGKALSEIRASAFTDAELAGYDKFWDQVSVEVTLYNSGERKGRAEGRAEGRVEGLAEGRAEGRVEGLAEGRLEGERQKALEIARKLKALGQSVTEIASLTGLSLEEVERI